MANNSKKLLDKSLPVKISASIMCANLGCLSNDLQVLEQEGIDMIHYDIMDGHFVPNLALSPIMIPYLKSACSIPFDVHLMVTHPEQYLSSLFDYNVECITVHVETLGTNCFRLIRTIKNRNILVGIAINPVTPLNYLNYLLPYVDKITIMTVDPGFAGQQFINSTLSKVAILSKLKKRKKHRFLIEVDGAINSATFKQVISAGAEILVVGSSGLFARSKDLREAVRQLRHELYLIMREIKREGGEGC